MSTPASRIPSGVVGFDDVLAGGFVPDRLYLLEGDPGSGKTTLALQFLLAGVAAGKRCLYITLCETREELLAGATSHGWSLEGIEILELLSEEKDLSPDAHLTMYSPSEVELSETTRAVLEAVNRLNPSLVVFDSLSEMRLLAQNPLRYRRQVLALKQYFIGRHCTVLLVDDGSNDRSELQLQSIAHGVITLEQHAPVYGRERRRLRVKKFRGVAFRGGYHDFSIEQGGIIVFPRLVSAEHTEVFEHTQIKSGLPRLDALLGGGPDRGTSTLLMGPAGSGKSTIALQYAAAAAARGEHAAIFAFDEAAHTLRLRASSIGITFKEGRGPGEIRVRQVDPAELSPGEFVHLVRHAVEHDRARVVVIDTLNGYLNAMPEEQFLVVQMHEVLSYLSRQGVTTFLVLAQQGLLGMHVQTPIETSYLADSVVLFRYFECAGRVRKAIS
ncbi:MAG TPA: ATPase domain-containing protein, partial [Candidatus Synoicihabitans sp.]|nr:ATPase domain-containing protein [Candidatus Synoicihabitans sp.]